MNIVIISSYPQYDKKNKTKQPEQKKYEIVHMEKYQEKYTNNSVSKSMWTKVTCILMALMLHASPQGV